MATVMILMEHHRPHPSETRNLTYRLLGILFVNTDQLCLKPSTLVPIVVQQPLISPPASPISSSFALHRQSNNQLPGTLSSSDVSSASSSSSSPSSATSVIISKSSHDSTRFPYVAIFDYDARTEEDLTMRKNDQCRTDKFIDLFDFLFSGKK
jgi:hypothetical protein